MGEPKRLPLPKICHTYPTMMEFGTAIPYLKKIQKYINHVTHPLSSADISIFSPKISKFCYIKKYRYRLDFESLVIVLINMVTILIMSAKMATRGLLKISVLWNKGYDVIVSVHDVTSRILSRDSNYIIDVVMWPKFSNCSISMRKVIITSIL